MTVSLNKPKPVRHVVSQFATALEHCVVGEIRCTDDVLVPLQATSHTALYTCSHTQINTLK